VKRSDGRLSRVREKQAVRQLTSLLARLDRTLPRVTARDTRRVLGSQERLKSLHETGREGLWEEFGFCLDVCESRLTGGGRGVAISQGKVPAGHLVALYPGTVYMPHEPLLLQSLRNPFVFRCVDGVMIDGNHRGLSRWIYK
ncbi:SET domain-containing protein 9, partial [Geodia barretti]